MLEVHQLLKTLQLTKELHSKINEITKNTNKGKTGLGLQHLGKVIIAFKIKIISPQ